MTVFEELMKYKIALEIGLLSKESLLEYVDDRLLNMDSPPGILVDIAYSSKKSLKEITSLISNRLWEDCFRSSPEQDAHIENSLVEIIREQYESSKISIKETVHFLYCLSLHFEQHSEMNAIEDYYELAMAGMVFTMEDVNQKLYQILYRTREI